MREIINLRIVNCLLIEHCTPLRLRFEFVRDELLTKVGILSE